MNGTFEAASPRFFRPADVARVRRNHRRVQLQRSLAVLRNVFFLGLVAGAGVWMWRHTQSDARFAVRHIEVAGAVRTPRPAIDAVVARYEGTNLFQIDIARVQRDLRSLAWIERIAIEKKIPDTLRIRVIERTPVALARRGTAFHYVDGSGVVVARLSPAIGDADLPVIDAAVPAETARTVRFLEALRKRDAAVYSRIAEISPVAPRGFAVFDRDLGTTVYVNEQDAAEKWRALVSIVQAERLGRFEVAYADLRFANRVVVKPARRVTAGEALVAPQEHEQITN